MSAATRQIGEPLVYRDGDFLHFADIESVRPLITSPQERQFLAKALLRNATVLVRLSVDPSSDINALATYWGTGGRRTDIRPLLESVAQSGDSRCITSCICCRTSPATTSTGIRRSRRPT